MEIFLDTADINEIRQAAELKVVDGVTTNPSLMAKTGRNVKDVILEIAGIINGPISAEVVALNAKEMIEEGRALSDLHDNIVIKLPLTEEGLKACRYFTDHDIKTNVTLVFSANQALLAAKCGATYVSPFVGRLDDIGQDGMHLIEEIRTMYDNYGFTTKILAASIRHPEHVRDAAMVGANVVTLPLKTLKMMYQHPLTEKGIQQFLEDFKKANIRLL